MQLEFTKSLLNRDQEIVVAVSGGVDSIALAYFLSKGFNVSVWHFNHKLRSQNDEMERAVTLFCKSNGISLYVDSAEAYPIEGSTENDYRNARLGALNTRGFQTVVTCHHLDDCIESYLMNCFRGHPEYLPIPLSTEFNNYTIVRPFLLTKKEAIVGYAARNKLMDYVVEDETNVSMAYRRNVIRHKLRPAIEEYYGIEKVVYKRLKKEFAVRNM